MADKKIKVTIEEEGKEIKSWEGTAAYIAVCGDEGVEGTSYGCFSTMSLATMIDSLKQEIKYLLDKYGDDDLKFLLALYEMRNVLNIKDEKGTKIDEDSFGGDSQ